MAKIEKIPTAEFHSGYGCIIVAAAAAVFGFIIWWAWYSLQTMDREIGLLTQPQPAKLAEVAPVPELTQKLADFAAAATAGKPATLKLSVAELNALIVTAPDAGNGTYKEMVRVKSLDTEKKVIVTDANLPMNTAKFWEPTKRYLVGEVDFNIEMTTEGPDAKVHAVRIPGKTVPEGMLQGMQMYGYMGPYQTHPQLGSVIKTIKKATIEADGVLLSTQP